MSRTRTENITKTLVDGLKPGEQVRDARLRGFGVRRQKGLPVFFVQKRVRGIMRWMTIGTYGSPWTVHMARHEALKLLGDIAKGIDPQEAKIRERGGIRSLQCLER